MFLITDLQESNLEDLATLDEEVFEDFCLPIGTLRKEWRAGAVPMVVDLDVDKLAAYAVCRYEDGIVDILRLGVGKRYRGHGLARGLLDDITWRYPGKPRMLCVRKENARARGIYLKAGFRIVSQIDLSWVMRRDC